MRLLSYNIRYGGVGREKAIAAVIASCEPDIVILQEATDPDVVRTVASNCGMKWCGALRGHSVAYLSRVEVAEAKWQRAMWARRRYLELTLPQPGMRIFGVHLAAIHSNPSEFRRTLELRALLRGITAGPAGFHVVTGDFNTLAPGEPLDVRRLPPRLRAIVWATGRNIRWRTIQMMIDRGYSDGYRLLHPKAEAYTFPTWDPHVRLDYIFLPRGAGSRLTRCEVVREAPGVREASDHFPLLSELGEAPAQGDGPVPLP